MLLNLFSHQFTNLSYRLLFISVCSIKHWKHVAHNFTNLSIAFCLFLLFRESIAESAFTEVYKLVLSPSFYFCLFHKALLNLSAHKFTNLSVTFFLFLSFPQTCLIVFFVFLLVRYSIAESVCTQIYKLISSPSFAFWLFDKAMVNLLAHKFVDRLFWFLSFRPSVCWICFHTNL